MRRIRRRLPLALVLLPLLAGNVTLYAAEEKAATEQPKFLRFVEERDGGRLETGVATYKNAQGVTVTLIGAVHVADTGYFQALNKDFQKYDALLYEMVKPADMGAPDKEEANGISFVHILQKGLKMFLDLDYQLDGIDYQAKNFVHADLTAEEFNRMQDERGESIFGLMLQQMMKELMKGDDGKAAQDIDPMELLAALGSEDSARKLKLILARQFENMDEMVAGLEGPNGSVLVTERNKAALRVLKDQIASGKKNLAIFYGAAHLKDMDKRLTQDMGFKRTGMEYRVAWDLSPRNGARNNGNGAANANSRSGQIDDRDEQIKKLREENEQLKKRLDKLDQIEKRLDEIEKKK